MSSRPKPATSFKPLGTERDLLDDLHMHQSISSDASIGERLAASLLSKTPKGIAKVVRNFEAEDEAGHAAIEYLEHAQGSLSVRLKYVEDAIARLGTVGGLKHGDGS